MKRTTRGRRRLGIGRWLVLLLAVAIVVWTYRSTWLTRGLEFAVAQPGKINHEYLVPATFANQEYLVPAPIGGRVQFSGVEGQRFRRGETIGRVEAVGAVPGVKASTSLSQDIVALRGGLFYQSVDGLESIYTPDNLLTMELDKLLEQQGTKQEPKTTVQASETVGKIVDNLMPTVGFIEVPNVDKLTVGQTIRFTVHDQTQSGKIVRLSAKPTGIVVQFAQFVDSSVEERHQSILWQASPAVEGVVIPQSALYTSGEEVGVYVVSEGVLDFRAVKILDQDEKKVCVENLPSGISVVKNPRSGLEGIPVRVKNP